MGRAQSTQPPSTPRRATAHEPTRPRGQKQRLGSPRARLFVALEPPADAVAGLGAWQSSLLAATGGDVRPVPAQSMHVTLAFIGYRPEREIDAIAEAVARAAADRPAVPLAFAARLRSRPGGRRPRLYTAPVEPHAALMDLRAAIADELTRAKLFTDERREFWPHLTLGRVKSSARDHRLPAELPAAPKSLAERSFAATRVVVLRSHLERAGARYEQQASVTLAPTPAATSLSGQD